jgi:hypothetical protein
LQVVSQFVYELGLTDLENFELMKRGHAYMVGNSTFSWWAAFLSDAKPENIFSPDPWFAITAEPVDMSPVAWMRLPSSFEQPNGLAE